MDDRTVNPILQTQSTLAFDFNREEVLKIDACDAVCSTRASAVNGSTLSLESTPVRVGEGMYYLGRAGIYRTALEDGVPSEPELVFNTEGRDRDVWEQQLLAADGMLYFVGGPHGERWLYAIGPADDA